MATKKIQIEFDMNTNEVKLAGEATMSLAQQVRILQRELSKTPEGTKEFQLLRNKLNDTKDNFERVNVKSRELFGTLSLLPGPIGEIAGKINGAISLLKVFSGFTLKDLSGQFKALGQDIAQIFKSISRWGEESDKLSGSLEKVAAATNNNIGVSTAAAAIIQNNIKAEDGYIDAIKQKIDVEKSYQELLQELKTDIEKKITIDKTVADLTDEQRTELEGLNKEIAKSKDYQKGYTDELDEATGSVEENTSATKQNATAVNTDTAAEKTNTTAKKSNSIVTSLLTTQTRLQGLAADQAAAGNVVYATTLRGVAVAAGAAATAIRIFKAVLISTGIGLLIVGLSELLTRIYEYVSGTDEATAATKAFNDELERQNRQIDLEAAAIKRANDLKIAELKSSGATERRIRQEQLKQRQADLDFALKNEAQAAALYNKSRGSADEQTLKSLGDNLIKRQELVKDARNKLRIDTLDAIVEDRKDRDDADKEELENTKAKLDAKIELEIREEKTNSKKLTQLFNERYELEIKDFKGSEEEKLLIRKDYDKKLEDAILEDSKRELELRKKNIDARIEIESNAAQVDINKLIQLLQEKRDIELEDAELTGEQKLAITSKYEKQIRDLRQKQFLESLSNELNNAGQNYDLQIEIYKKYLDNIEQLTFESENAKFEFRKNIQDKINALTNSEYELAVSKTNQKYGYLKEQDVNYYQEQIQNIDDQLARLDKYYSEEDKKGVEYNKKVEELTNQRVDLSNAEANVKIANAQLVGNFLSAAAGLAGESTKLGKGLAVASATIDTYAGAAKALKDYKYPLGAIVAATVIATGLMNVRKILSVKIPDNTLKTGAAQFSGGVINVNKKAQGGIIRGPGGETSDSIPALLSDGEYIVNARSTRMFRPLLETINTAANLPQFAVGGLVRESKGMTPMKSDSETLTDAISSAFGQTPIRTYVTANEVSNQQQFERIIKSRSLI